MNGTTKRRARSNSKQKEKVLSSFFEKTNTKGKPQLREFSIKLKTYLIMSGIRKGDKL